MTCMHSYLVLKYRPPSSMLHHHRVPSKEFFVLLINWLFRVLAIHLAVNAVPILGYPRWLLLLLFIKHDHDLKCCVAWFIMNALNQSFIFWMLLRIVLSLIMHIVPTLVKRFSIVDLILDCQSVMNLPPVGTTLFKYMLSSIFLETIQSSRHASHSL